MNEEWRPIDDFPGYEVSNFGRVRSLDRVVVGPKRKTTMHGRVLRAHRDEDGYQRIVLIKNGKSHWKGIHRLVLIAFVGDQPDKIVRHLDNDPSNNRLDNIVWGTHLENQNDRIAAGTSNHGEKNGAAFLVEYQVIEIRARRSAGETITSLAREFGVTPTLINKIAIGEIWEGVGGPRVKPFEILAQRKLDEAKVLEIRHRRSAGEGLKELAAAFEVEHTSIAGICLGKTWKHVGGPITRRQIRKARTA